MEGTKVRAAFVGRIPELDHVAAALARTRDGGGITVLCGGEAGIGKTRFVHEVADRARKGGCVVLIGGCVEMGPAGLPYGPFAEALRGAVATDRLDPSRLHPVTVEQLAILIPDIGPSDARSRVEADLAGLGQVRLFEAVLTAIEEARRGGPLMLVVEDIHWADRSTLDLLTFLVRNVDSSGVLLLVTFRDDEIDRTDPLNAVLTEFGRRPSVDRLDLRALDLQEAMDHLASILGAPPDPELARHIHRRSDGNPFFIEQLAWAYADGESTTVPASLRDILLTQLSRQPPGVQDLLAAASIAGPLADDRLLASVMGGTQDDILEPLRLAVRSGLIARTPTGDGESYAFRHALLAEATEADLLEGERRRLHARCADALLMRRPADGASLVPWAVRVAHHRDRSGEVDATVAASIEAAIQTGAVAAHADAMKQYRRAIGLLPAMRGETRWGDWDASELFARSAACAALIGETTAAAAYTREAIERLPADADPWRRGRLLLALAEHLWIAGDGSFVDALADAERVIPRDPPTAERADALIALAYHHQFRGDEAAALHILEEAVATALAADTPREESLARILIVVALVETGAIDAGERQLEQAVMALRRTSPRPETSVAYMNIASIAAWVGREELSLTVCQEGLDLARRYGFETYYGGGLAANGAETLLSLGRLDEAAAMLESVEATPAGGYVDTLRRLASSRVWTQLGDLERAGEDLRAAHAWPAGGDAALGRWLGVAEAEWQLEHGPADAVEALVLAALALPDSHMPDLDLQATLTWLAVRAAADVAERARASRDGGAVQLALETGDRHLDRAQALVDSPRIREALSPMRRRAAAFLAMAIAEGTRLHDRPDPGAWSAAVAAGDGRAMALRTIYARIRQAEACLAIGRETRPEAVHLLVDAHVLAQACGSRRLVEMSEGIARRARIDLGHGRPAAGGVPQDRAPAAVDPAHGYGLTPREIEILGLLAIGLTNRQIGERLFISPKTAGVHVSNILGKLELDSRIQAATLAHRLGIATVMSD